MIRIVRDVAPGSLRTAQQTQLREIAKLDAGQQPPKKSGAAKRADYLVGYDEGEVKPKLYADQHKKCAWCERRQSFSSSPVEHVRPKDGAWRDVPEEPRKRRNRKGAPSSPDCYWWLTWTWGNLLFSCARCNDGGHKANYFPLVPGTAELVEPTLVGEPLPAEAFDTAGELPLLLDPTEPDFDFLDHVRWEPAQTKLARSLWIWTPKARSPRGDATIKILKLGEFAEEVRAHLVATVLPSVEEIEQHFEQGRRAHGARRWSTLLATALDRSAQLTAATWCGLEAWMPAAMRRAWGLPDPPRP